MSDIALITSGLRIDLGVDKSDLVLDEGLRTAVLISLFTDRRVTTEEIPEGHTKHRGWWGDLFPDAPGDLIGSRLWLLSREKKVPETLARAKEYAEEALQWMIEDGIADSVTVTPEWMSDTLMGLLVEITKPNIDPISYKFEYAWTQELQR